MDKPTGAKKSFDHITSTKKTLYMKILVTGGAGFIGSSLAEYLLNKTEAQVVVVDNYLTGRQQNLPASDRFRFIKADANDFDDISSIFQTFGFDYVFFLTLLPKK